jgi:alanine racemase
MSRDTLARIDTEALRHNLGVVRSLAPGSRIVSVVKADAYGHGADRVLAGLADSDVLAVATVGELRALRAAGWGGRLLLLEGFAGDDEYDVVSETGAEYVVHHESQLERLAARGGHPGRPVWLKMDTGMHRLGFPIDRLQELVPRLKALAGGEAPVLMSHFASADDPDDPLTRTQLERFEAATRDIDAPVSLANSAGLLNVPESRREYVRPGILLYGISPLPNRTGADHGLKPVMTLSARLLAVNTVAAGERVGYGGRFRCPETMHIGVAGVGYGDGYPRAVPDGTPVLLNGRRALVAGRVSMDLLTLDLRGHEDAQVGDEVVLWGEGLPVEEVAEAAGMIPYELVCGVTGRVRRLSVE